MELLSRNRNLEVCIIWDISIYLFIHPSIYLSIFLSVCPSVRPVGRPAGRPFVHLNQSKYKPQSCSLLTGQKCSAVLKFHFFPFPVWIVLEYIGWLRSNIFIIIIIIIKRNNCIIKSEFILLARCFNGRCHSGVERNSIYPFRLCFGSSLFLYREIFATSMSLR